MFFQGDITGDRMPQGTLCLTYDDGPGETPGTGPGPRTREIGTYLFDQQIRATFFVVGRHAERHPTILEGLRSQGHLIGNHTYDHVNLTTAASPVDQVARADRVIRPHGDGEIVFFRPPYGAWRLGGGATSPMADALNRSGRTAGHVGPVMWDIGCLDWEAWRDGLSPRSARFRYLAQIEQLGRGIVLIHDSTADLEDVRSRNQGLALTMTLVPLLKERGFRFLRLDDVPQVASAAAVAYESAFRTSSGMVLEVSPGSGQVVARAGPVGVQARFGVVGLGHGLVVLRAAGGQYLSARRGGGGVVLANAPVVGDWESMGLDELGEGRVAIRTIRGSYLTIRDGPDGLLRADATSTGLATSFILLSNHRLEGGGFDSRLKARPD